ncbi:hypothetical protein [Colwellia sp. MB02u-9]|jgi:hypothetical protein|uniref:hypothetical protein n=1 Tax=Colwellia sp. MB02u-9 TaxID=2759823 RepID=UPI0015F68B25|nr:hypothetical protein [Colwellia sp. MB02u-9]MBA6297813.1 hypothetical protein [Colwellia sp. MB02u-9]
MANKLGAYKKKKANIDNLLEREKLLLRGLENPKNITRSLSDSLIGQKKFANLKDEKNNITPLSLNTIKSISEEIFSKGEDGVDGFEYIDGLRKKLCKLTDNKKSDRSNKNNLANKKRANDELMNKLHQVELLNIQRSKAYLDLFQRLRMLSKERNIDDMTLLKLNNILEDHTILYCHLLSPGPTDGTGTILRIIDNKKDE